MPGKILIAEPLATNRILLKVKLAAGHFEVIQASDAAETLRAIRLEAPDLVLLNSGLAGDNLATLIDAIRALPGQADLPIAALITEHLPEAARRDLAGRVDALLVRPTTDTLLLARLRGLLVQRNTLRDLRLQSGGGAPGFAEPAVPRLQPPGHIAILAPQGAPGQMLLRGLSRHLRHSLRLVDAARPFPDLTSGPRPDVVLLYLPDMSDRAARELVAELRAARSTRHAAALALLDSGAEETALHLLEARVEDVMMGRTDARELAARCDRLLTQAQELDHLRRQTRDGVRASVTDPLTGLYNRRFALPFLERVCSGQEGAGTDTLETGFAVMLADLDFFKNINDKYGHSGGDQVLRQVADHFRAILRDCDMVARIGGEEFLLVCPGVTPDEARQTADRICREIADTAIPLTGYSQPVHITVSIGLVMGRAGRGELSPTGGESERLLARADAALYASKAHGRNTVTYQPRSAA